MYSRRSEDNSRNGGSNSGSDEPPMSRECHVSHGFLDFFSFLVLFDFSLAMQVCSSFAINQIPRMIFVKHSKNLAKSKRFIVWRIEVRATTRASFTLNTLKHRKRLMHSKKWTENALAFPLVHVRWKCWSLQGINSATQVTIGNGLICKNIFFTSRNQGSGRSDNEQEKYVRLFVIVPKGLSEDELREEFSKYGEIDGITMIRDKVTRECKGFAYIKYFKWVSGILIYEAGWLHLFLWIF